MYGSESLEDLVRDLVLYVGKTGSYGVYKLRSDGGNRLWIVYLALVRGEWVIESYEFCPGHVRVGASLFVNLDDPLMFEKLEKFIGV